MSKEQEINRLIRILKENPYGAEGRTASKELIELSASAVPLLLMEIEKYDSSSGEIMALVQVLGAIGEAQAIPLLRRLLTQIEPGPVENMNAYWCISIALGRCGDKSVFPNLIDALCGAGHIEYVGAHLALTALGSEVISELLEVLADPEPWVHRHLQLHHPQHLANSRLVDKSSWSLRCSIIRILGEIRDEQAIPVLLELLNTPDSGIFGRGLRNVAITSLAEFGGNHAIPYLVRELDNSGDWACIHAARTLNKLDVVKKQPEIIQKELVVLSRALKSKFANTRVFAAEVLAKIDDPRVVPLLKGMLADTDEYPRFSDNKGSRVCDRVAELLMEIGTPEALAAVETWRKT